MSRIVSIFNKVNFPNCEFLKSSENTNRLPDDRLKLYSFPNFWVYLRSLPTQVVLYQQTNVLLTSSPKYEGVIPTHPPPHSTPLVTRLEMVTIVSEVELSTDLTKSTVSMAHPRGDSSDLRLFVHTCMTTSSGFLRSKRFT